VYEARKDATMEENWVKKFRVLTFSLIGSGALNIGLIAALGLGSTSEESAPSLAKKVQEQKVSNMASLQAMSKLSFRELVALLTNREMVEEGYAKRDLALSALTAFHHFNLEKALGSPVAQKREISLEEGKLIELYPSFSEDQFAAVIRFAYQEKWPLTAKGLFALLQKLPAPRDETLEQAFFVTPEFYALQVLFQKTGSPQENPLLLKLISEGSWDLLEQFTKEQTQLLDLSVEKRRRLLLSYLAQRSPASAELLLKTDFAFVRQKFDDQGLGSVVTLLPQKTEEAERFCTSLLQAPRSDAVWRAAAEKLYSFAGEAMPEPLDLKAAALRFGVAAKAPAKSVPERPAAQAGRSHTVKEGDSLWKIARQYKVKVEEITRLNELENRPLKPGMTIKIPN
jgi:hypothetical protein